MKKKIVTAGLIGILLAAAAACGDAQDAASTHTHVIVGGWQMDAEKHWHVCENGENVDEEPHKLENDVCTVCGSEIFTYEDGSAQLAVYDEQGNCTQLSVYGTDGSVERTEYEYNEDGSWMSEKVYTDEVLSAERTYEVDADGLQTPITEILYNEDGSYTGMEYDVFGELVIEVYVDAQGNTEHELRYEHTYDDANHKEKTMTYSDGVLIEETEYINGTNEDGSWSMSAKTTVYHDDGTKTVTDSDEELNWFTEITYDAEGNVTEELRYEYEKNEEGEDIGSKGYRNGDLFQEFAQVTNADGEVTGFMEINYAEDGGKTVCEYDENFEVIKETVYDADGNISDN